MSHHMLKQFGGKLSNDLKVRYAKSANWKDEKFENLEETHVDFSFHNLPRILYKQFVETKGRAPASPLPIEAFNAEQFLSPSDEPKFVWFGHSAVLIRWNNKTILIDPMLRPDAAPIAPFASKRFSEKTLDIINDLPNIDLLLLTHDHYDHLDLVSVEKLIPKTTKWFVALGIGRHLESWGVSPNDIQEFDWWDEDDFEDIHFTFTPSRHSSGRGIRDQSKSLWGGWAMKSDDLSLYWSGDGGYGKHFKEIGEKLGPFDFGFIECGQYNEYWHQIHMMPEESVQAAIDTGAKRALPVHWCGFALALHHWQDPVNRFTAAAAKNNLNIITPKLGQLVALSSETEKWWMVFE